MEAVDARLSKRKRIKKAKEQRVSGNGRRSKERRGARGRAGVVTENEGRGDGSVSSVDAKAMGRTNVGIVETKPVVKPTKMRVRRLSSGGTTGFTRRLQSMYADSPTNPKGTK